MSNNNTFEGGLICGLIIGVLIGVLVIGLVGIPYCIKHEKSILQFENFAKYKFEQCIVNNDKDSCDSETFKIAQEYGKTLLQKEQ